MVLLRKKHLACSALLLACNAGWATASAQSPPTPTPEPAAASRPSDEWSRAAQSAPAPADTPPAGPPGQGAPQPGQPPLPAVAGPTPADVESSRFNMQENGVNRTADEFDAWLRARGVRVATGEPVLLVQNCPTPDGDKGDDDGDGIINCLDQCPGSVAGQAIGTDGCPASISIDLQGVTFAYDAARLDASARGVLDQAVEILKRHEGLKVEVAGHTDSRGDADYNQRLSERRAQAVYDYLVEQGIDAARLIGPVGYGETRPLVPNQNPDGSDNPEARARNRRTELNIQS